MSERKTVKLGEVAFVNAKSISKLNQPTRIKYVDIESVDCGEIKEPKNILFSEAPSRARRILSDNDIIISTVRPNLKHYAYIKKAEENLIASTGFAVISSKKEIDSRFLYYYLGSDDYTEYLISRTEGAAYPAFNPDVLIKSELTLPPLPIQKKIAKVLGDLDDKIELNRRMNETLEEMAMAVYRYYFVNFGLPPGAKEEATECPFGKLIEHPEMGMIPEVWSVGKLGDVVSNFDNKRIPLSKNQKMSCVKKNIPIMELHQS